MKISEINKLKNEEKYIVIVDNGIKFTATLEDLVKYDIKIDKVFSEEEINNIIYNCEFSNAYNYALFILGTKQYSEKEMIVKLKKRNYSENVIDMIIEKLKNYKFLDDERYATQFVSSCINKKIGPKQIKYRLNLKGINSSELQIDEETLFKNAKELALKKIKNIKDNKNIKAKLYNFLIYKGYENEIIFNVLKDLFNDISEDGDLQ